MALQISRESILIYIYLPTVIKHCRKDISLTVAQYLRFLYEQFGVQAYTALRSFLLRIRRLVHRI